MGDAMDVNFRFLGPDEGGILTEAIEAAYGTTYDVRWVYDQAEVSARLADGRYVSCVAETATGELLCHMGMSLAAAGDAVAHSGQAVTLEAARGQHLFTRTKRFLMDWARDRGPGRDVQRGDRRPPLQPAGEHRAGGARDRLPARLDPGLGQQRRRRRGAAPAAVGGALLHQAQRRPRAPRLRAGAPPRDRRPDAGALRAAGDAGEARARSGAGEPERAARRGRTRTTTWP